MIDFLLGVGVTFVFMLVSIFLLIVRAARRF